MVLRPGEETLTRQILFGRYIIIAMLMVLRPGKETLIRQILLGRYIIITMIVVLKPGKQNNHSSYIIRKIYNYYNFWVCAHKLILEHGTALVT